MEDPGPLFPMFIMGCLVVAAIVFWPITIGVIILILIGKLIIG